jgi:hypothetical protein
MAAPITDSVISFMLRSTSALSGDEEKIFTTKPAEIAAIFLHKGQREKHILNIPSSQRTPKFCNKSFLSYTDLCVLCALCGSIFLPFAKCPLR